METVKYGIQSPGSDFDNRGDKGSDSNVSYKSDSKLPRKGGVGNAHTQQKNAGVGGKNYRGR